MAMTKAVPVTVDTVAARISAAKTRIEDVKSAIAESKGRLEFLRKRHADLKAKAAELGVADTAQLAAAVEACDGDLQTMIRDLEAAIAQAEKLING